MAVKKPTPKVSAQMRKPVNGIDRGTPTMVARYRAIVNSADSKRMYKTMGKSAWMTYHRDPLNDPGWKKVGVARANRILDNVAKKFDAQMKKGKK